MHTSINFLCFSEYVDGHGVDNPSCCLPALLPVVPEFVNKEFCCLVVRLWLTLSLLLIDVWYELWKVFFLKICIIFVVLIEMTSKQSLVLITSQVSFVCLSWPVLFWKHLWFVNCHLSLPSRGILEWVSNRSILSMWKWMQKVNYLSSILYKMCY